MTEDLYSSFQIKTKVPNDALGWNIDGIVFDILSNIDIINYSEVRINNSRLYLNNRPAPYGPNDPHLGVNRASDSSYNKSVVVCATCNNSWDDCVGHWGYIALPNPVFHPGYMKHLLMILSSICKDCSYILLPVSMQAAFAAKIGRIANDNLMRIKLFRIIVETCKKYTKCNNCNSVQGTLRRINQGTPDAFMKIIYEIKIKNDASIAQKIQVDLSPKKILEIFRKIPLAHRKLLFISNPESLLIQLFHISPSSIRPTINLGHAGVNEDDLTITIKDIVHFSQKITESIKTGQPINQIVNYMDALQANFVRYINTDYSQLQKVLHALANAGTTPKIGRGIAQRLKGKDGRFRGNLSGKRVNFSGRTVISPDPNCPINSVIVPMLSAMKMTFPEIVSVYNISKLRECVIRGPDKWPGALSIIKKNKNLTISLKFVNRINVADQLELGDTVERHMWENDMLLFNRQPSLHRLSIMAHKSKIMPWRTLRFNECVCAPYNADFDGDEMNYHLPQTQEARAEAYYLMNVTQNMTTPKNGATIIASTQDFLSSSYLITYKNVFLTREKICQYLTYATDGKLQLELVPPAILKPHELWTGKQLFSMLIRPSSKSPVIVNLELRERDFKESPNMKEWMCINDGYVVIQKSELLCGAIGKNTLGSDNKQGIYFKLIHYSTKQAAINVMERICKLSGRWFSERGMTIGIDDVAPNNEINIRNKNVINNGYQEVQKLQEMYDKKMLLPDPGCSLLETLENRSKAVLDNLRSRIGETIISALPSANKPLIMYLSGAKGSLINIAQMISFVGQQNVDGKRIQDGFIERTLPHYPMNANRIPKAKGFVSNSFYSGLDPDEFFFHTMSGREGLVDTAVKTADTGYLQRRLIKAMEDLSVKYDTTVRTSDNQIVQFIYGDDGFNSQLMEKKFDLISFDATYQHICSINIKNFTYIQSLCQSTHNSNASTKRLYDETNGQYFTDEYTVDEASKYEREKFYIIEEMKILPPINLKAVELSLRNYLIDTDFGINSSNMPSSIKNKLNLALNIARKYDDSNPKQFLLDLFTNNTNIEDNILLSIKNNLIAWKSVFIEMPVVKLHSPLLPYEFLAWANYLINLTTKMIGNNFEIGQKVAINELPTHQKGTEKIRIFSEELLLWINEKAEAVARRRKQNGENPAKEYNDYLNVIHGYYLDIKNKIIKDDNNQYVESYFERRLWINTKANERISNNTTRITYDDDDGNCKDIIGETYRIYEWESLKTLYDFLIFLFNKYTKGLIQPGEAVGAIGAQSIGEPGTQMTLKTFHFAGVASMNVTLGVPRIKEIINATAKISSPIIIIPLLLNKNKLAYAQMIKANLQCVYLKQICKYFKQVISSEGAWVVVRLDKNTLNNNYINIDAEDVKNRIYKIGSLGKMKLKHNSIEVVHKYKLIIKPSGGMGINNNLTFQLITLIQNLYDIPISGIETVKRCIIQSEKKGDTNEYLLVVEGTGLRNIINIEGVDGYKVNSNNIMEVKQILGIEAGRQIIISEIKKCMDVYGIDIDIRHIRLLADVMTFRGELLGINRHGIKKMTSSTLCLASFEQTNEHLFDAAVHKREEKITGVSESIILGKRVSLGSGCFDILQDTKDLNKYNALKTKPRSFLLSKILAKRSIIKVS